MTDAVKIDSLEGFERLKSVWNDLLARSDFDSIFLTYEWLFTWWKVYGPAHELYILAIRDNDTIIGLAPLMRTDGRVIRFIGTPNADYCDFLGHDKNLVISGTMTYLKQHHDEWNRIEFSQIPETSASCKILESRAREMQLLCGMKAIETCYVFKYDGEEEGRKEFSLKRGTSLKRFMNFFNKMDGLNLEHYRDADRITSLLPQFYHSHAVRWKDRITGGKFENPQNRQFHEALVGMLAPQNRLRLTILRHGNTPLAYLYAFDYKGRLNLYNIATESFYEKKSAGIILLHLLTEQAVRDGYDVIDFSRGEGGHKERFVNGSSNNYQMTIYSNKPPYYVSGIYDAVKRNKFVERAIQICRLKNFRDRLASRYHHDGLGGIIEHVLKSIAGGILEIKRVTIFRLEKNAGRTAARDDVRIEQLNADDIEKIGSFMGFAIDSEKYKIDMDRFSRGSCCYILKCGDKIASMGWVVLEKDFLPEVEREFEIGTDQVLLSDFYTSPIFKEHGFTSYLLESVADMMLAGNKEVLVPDYLTELLSEGMAGKTVLSRINEIREIKFLGIRLN